MTPRRAPVSWMRRRRRCRRRCPLTTHTCRRLHRPPRVMRPLCVRAELCWVWRFCCCCNSDERMKTSLVMSDDDNDDHDCVPLSVHTHRRWTRADAQTTSRTDCLGCTEKQTGLSCEGCGAPTCPPCATQHDAVDRGEPRLMYLCHDCYHCDYVVGGDIVQIGDVKWTHMHALGGNDVWRYHNLRC